MCQYSIFENGQDVLPSPCIILATWFAPARQKTHGKSSALFVEPFMISSAPEELNTPPALSAPEILWPERKTTTTTTIQFRGGRVGNSMHNVEIFSDHALFSLVYGAAWSLGGFIVLVPPQCSCSQTNRYSPRRCSRKCCKFTAIV